MFHFLFQLSYLLPFLNQRYILSAVTGDEPGGSDNPEADPSTEPAEEKPQEEAKTETEEAAKPNLLARAKALMASTGNAAETIAKLQATISGHEATIKGLTDEKAALAKTVADLEATNAKLSKEMGEIVAALEAAEQNQKETAAAVSDELASVGVSDAELPAAKSGSEEVPGTEEELEAAMAELGTIDDRRALLRKFEAAKQAGK